MGSMRHWSEELPPEIQEMVQKSAVAGHVFNLARHQGWTREQFSDRLAVELNRMAEQYLDVILKYDRLKQPPVYILAKDTEFLPVKLESEMLREIAVDVGKATAPFCQPGPETEPR
jgi:methylase of polypeptide subunit release factors